MSSNAFWWLSWLLFVLVALGWYLSYTAVRLDRLHIRLGGTLAALDAQLVRRAEGALELANSGFLDAATSLILASAASEALDTAAASAEAGAVDESAESDLTEAIEVALTPETVAAIRSRGPMGDQLLDRLASAGARAQLARRFHNDAVTDVRRVRTKLAVRVFHLAGHTDLPHTVEFDDALPPALQS